MSLNINYCRLCLRKTEGPAETLSKDSETFKLVTNLFPFMDTSLVINSKICIECFKYAQFSNLMIETVTKNEQKILMDLQNTQLFEENTCRLCFNNEILVEAVCLFKNINEAARHVIATGIIDWDFDIFKKPIMCISCLQIVKSIYLFTNKCFATEKILKYYCATNKINSFDRKELEMVSSSYQEKLQQFSVSLDEDNILFGRNARSTGNSNLTQNVVNLLGMYLNNFIENKDNVFEEVSYIANTLNQSDSLKEEDEEIEIKEEQVCEFDNVDMAAVNLESITRIQQSEITSNSSEILINETENVENICQSIKFPSQPDIDLKEIIHASNDDILKKCLVQRKLKLPLSADKEEQFLLCDKSDYQTKNMLQLNTHCLLHDRKRNLQGHIRNEDSEHKTHLSLKCEDCPYVTREAVNTEVHLKAHQSNEKILKCSECYFITTCSNFLKNHMESHETKRETFKCQKRDYVMGRHTNLVNHLSIHQDICNFQCYNCNYQAKRNSDLVSHMLVHQKNYNFQCDMCSFQTKTKALLVRHMLIHQTNYKFPCDKCSYRTKIKSNLARHMLIHQENYNFHCHKCNYQAKRKADLVVHMLIHQENNKFPCNKCSHCAKTKSRLVRHMLVHQENYNFQCNECNYQAKRKTHLVSHMLIHQKIFKYPCDKCSYQAKRKSTLVKHMLVLHQENNNIRCYKCGYWAKSKGNLVSHMVIHQDDYSFPCHKCNYKAKRKGDLVVHMLVHQENYNFQCYECNHQTKRKNDLVRHMLIHQKNLKYTCDTCSYRTKIKSNLVRHMLRHQNGKNVS